MKEKTEDAFKKIAKQPLSNVEWVDPHSLTANIYNPNHVFKEEKKLLKLSILTDGWIAPITATNAREIVDGFHRWQLACDDKEVAAFTGGLVPVVFILPKTPQDQVASTIRLNRARGLHGILRMGEVVRDLVKEGKSPEEIQTMLGMDKEEFGRLADSLTAQPNLMGKDSFGRGWIPGKQSEIQDEIKAPKFEAEDEK